MNVAFCAAIYKQFSTLLVYLEMSVMKYRLCLCRNVQARGFTIDYLAHVPEVRDTVKKESLLHHLCTTVLEQFSDSNDLLSDVTSVSSCAKVFLLHMC